MSMSRYVSVSLCQYVFPLSLSFFFYVLSMGSCLIYVLSMGSYLIYVLSMGSLL